MENIFKTKDINLAAYLKFKGYAILHCEKEWSRIWFCFEDSEQREKDTLSFYNDEGGYQSYTNAWKDLKSLLHTMDEK